MNFPKTQTHRKKFATFRMACVCFLLPILFAGCQREASTNTSDLQRLSRLEIYAEDGTLLRTLEDTDSLSKWNSLIATELTADSDAKQTEYAKLTQNLPISCIIRSYQSAAAIGKEATLEPYINQTIYETTNIIKEEIAPEAIKNMPIAPEDLTFYVVLSEEEKQELLSFLEEKEEF